MEIEPAVELYNIWGRESTTGPDGWANDVYAVGGFFYPADNTPSGYWSAVVVHFDGVSWSIIHEE